ncbi:uncharacterized protein LOC141884465 isoform X2 [Acropora palmata]|uniref:uncharacterized protein LOC141884465 isoform X2 n=1 Tax=Acropora palmata TaxID=6131 RepID=UPI003DA019EC
MADETRGIVIRKLENLCAALISENIHYWKPEAFLGIPQHLFFPLLEKLHPLEIERLEDSGICQTLGINTNCLWQDMYFSRWSRKRKWPEVYFKQKRTSWEQMQWRVYYLQRHLQEAVNINHDFEGKEFGNSSSHKGHQDLCKTISICGKYATYLRLYNRACIYLAKNWEICQQLAKHVEFLEIFLLRDCGADALCCLLQGFVAKNLKSVSFSFCKVDNLQIWSKILRSLSPLNAKTSAHTSHLYVNSGIEQKSESLTKKIDKSNKDAICHQQDHKQGAKTSSKSTNPAYSYTADNILDTSSYHLNLEDVNIYDFSNGFNACFSQHCSDSRVCNVCLPNSTSCDFKTSTTNDSDLYDEVFVYCSCQHAVLKSSELCGEFCSTAEFLVDAESVTLPSISTSLLNPVFSSKLVHFELVAFWFQQDLLELLVTCLSNCWNLESLSLDDNGLGLILGNPQTLQVFTDTLACLCTKGQLWWLKITNNMLNDEASILLLEKLIGSFCLMCRGNTKSLEKLVFSSSIVSSAFSLSMGRAIRDVCTCNMEKSHLTDEISNKDKTGNTERVSLQMDKKCQDDVFGREKSCQSSERYNSNSLREEPAVKECRPTTSSERYTRGYDDTKMTMNHASADDEGNFSLDGNILSQRPNTSSFTVFDPGRTVSGIKELCLACPLFDQGASLIAGGLESNSSLHSLSLIHCNISTAGLADIFNSLSGNQVLKHLNVKGNSYDSGSNDSLAKMLKHNNALTALNLSSCKLGGAAHVTALSEVLTHPEQISRIEKLDLRNNPISLDSLSALASSLQCIKSRKLEEIKVTQNILGPQLHQALSRLKAVVKNVVAEHLDKTTLFADFVSQM